MYDIIFEKSYEKHVQVVSVLLHKLDSTAQIRIRKTKVKYDVEKEFADTISTEQYCIHNGGHLNAESNYIEFKELLKYI